MFDKRDETYFSALPIAHKKPLTLTYLDEMRAVEVKSDYSHIIIPVDNICAIYLWDAEADRYMEDYNAKHGIVAPAPVRKPKAVKEE